MAVIALGLLPPALRPSMLPGGLQGALPGAGAAGRGIHLVGGWILSDRDLARLRR
jgi:hypothetical protein